MVVMLENPQDFCKHPPYLWDEMAPKSFLKISYMQGEINAFWKILPYTRVCSFKKKQHEKFPKKCPDRRNVVGGPPQKGMQC
jgi:hypothetical protein